MSEKRVLLALEENGILLGDPFRAVSTGASNAAASAAVATASLAASPDPTAAKSRETNPFTGEID